ncbi:hypothetical protein OG716_09805 [Nocardia sp. NBC_01388]
MRLEYAGQANDSVEMLATMIVIVTIGIVIDRLFTAADHALRNRRGLIAE